MGKTTWAVAVIAVLAGATWLVGGWLADRASDDPVQSDAKAADLPEGAPLAEVVLPEALSPEAEIGKRAFDTSCASCHGPNAAGRNGAGPPLVHRIYEPSHHADVAFTMAVRSGVRAHHWRFGNMPAVEEQLTDAEIGYVVRYVRELQKANGID